MTTFVDLSHILEPDMPAYPGVPIPQFRTWFTHAESESRGAYAPGTTFQIATYEIGGNTGTYIDAPFHRHPLGPDLAGLALQQLANLQGVVVTVLHEGAIGPEVFQKYDLQGKAILVRTGWSKRWGNSDYFRSGPFLTAATCNFLVQAGAALVGIDCANIDDMNDATRPAHTILLAAGIPIVEHLCALEHILAADNFRFFAVPPAIKGGTSFPIRAFAMWE
ncbi:MAG: cyclase family protein [Ktedonobacteraceae bacterium]